MPYIDETATAKQLGLETKTLRAAICRAARITGFRSHDLRHCHASMLAGAGESLPVIRALLGHTQPGTTARYTHLVDRAMRRATERVGAKLGALAGSTIAEVLSIKKLQG